MDWDNDYYTFSDTNIEYIWRFLKGSTSAAGCTRATARRSGAPAAARRSRSTSRPARRSTRSSSTRRSTCRFPLQGARGRGARRLDDDAVDAARERRRRGQARRGVRALRDGRLGARAPKPTRSTTTSLAARSSSGSSTRARSTTCRRRRASTHRVIPWDEVSLDEGTGIVHIAPGCGAEDFELSRVHDLPVLMPIDESGRMLPGFGALEGISTDEVADLVIEELRERELLVERGRDHAPLPDLLALQDAARLPRRRRLVHLVRRDPAAAARRERDRRVDAVLLLEADGRLAAEHGRLEHLAQAVLRPAAAVLPVRVRRAERGRLAGGARGARDARASTSCRSCTGPGSTRCRSVRGLREGRAAHPRGRRRLARRRHRPLLDARLAEPGVDPGGYATGAVRGAVRRRPARPRVLGAVVPGGLGLGECASRSGSGSTRCSSCR